MKTKGIIVGGVVVLALAGAGFLLWKQRSEKKKQQEEEEKNKIDQAVSSAVSQAQAKAQADKDRAVQEVLEDVGGVKIGKFAYPKGANVNVRTEPKVNNGVINNLIYSNYTKRVGMIDKVVKSKEYGDKKKWYRVKLDEPKNNWFADDNIYGYVREDSITVKNK
jgi:type II secretory pathway component PulM